MEPGDRVFDIEDDDPDVAIVVCVPGDRTIADWTYKRDSEGISAADENPDYSADAQLVNVSFEEHLEQKWPEWKTTTPDEFWDEVCDREIPVYGFPEQRLGYVEPPARLEKAVEQIQENVEVVEWRPAEQHLYIERMDDTYVIKPDGTVTGKGIYADHLEDIVAENGNGSTYKYRT